VCAALSSALVHPQTLLPRNFRDPEHRTSAEVTNRVWEIPETDAPVCDRLAGNTRKLRDLVDA